MLYDITCMWNLKKKVQISLYTKQKHTQRCRKQIRGEQEGEEEGRDKLGVLG